MFAESGTAVNKASLLSMALGGAATLGGTQTYFNNIPVLAQNYPLIKGPYGTVGALGADLLTATNVTTLPANAISLAQSTDRSSFCIRGTNYPFLFCGDGGAIAGQIGNSSTTTWPSAITGSAPNITVQSKPYTGGTVFNSIFYANAFDWAIKHIGENKP